MRAAVYTRYGDPEVIELTERPTPTPVKDEILVKVHATSVTSGDSHMRKADPFMVRFVNGLFSPKNRVLGTEVAGTVESVGPACHRFKKGDPVFGLTGMKMGAHAEYVLFPGDGILAEKPSKVSFVEAAAIPFGGLTALHFLRIAETRPGKSLLVYGASGAVGVAAVQVGQALGATVTGVASGRNLGLVSELGASRMIDYTKEDFRSQDQVYDIIFDTVGKTTFGECKSVLNRPGVYVASATGVVTGMLQMLWTSLFGSQKVIAGISKETIDNLETIASFVRSGDLKPVIDSTYTFDRIVDAHRRVDSGHKAGSVVVELIPDSG